MKKEKQKVENAFEEFTTTLLDRVNTSESDINYIKDLLYEDKTLILEQIENLKDELYALRDDDTISRLSLEKAALEESFNAIKNDFTKLEELESNLYQLKDNMSDVDINLRDEVKDLSSKLEELDYRIREDVSKDLEDYSNDLSNLNTNVDTLNSYIEAIRENIQDSLNKSEELENAISKDREELENKLSLIKENLLSMSGKNEGIESLFNEEVKN